ncbi:tetratricopeptide repeat protein [Gimesia panareensis]|uniref:tetratricopeptide repeat protein n=1 Tax=Gimesia panareensis TaxID=2527978 RepID=UPI00118CD401|nr:tetratricopeptide repeat protein [Gimesia panareensis]QDU49999.1 hypothetical protein Pan110_23410 [Gimesia panareensis]
MRYILILSAACLFVGYSNPAEAQHHHGAHGHYHSYHGHGHSYPRYYGSNWASPGWSVSGNNGSVYFNFAFPGNTYYGNPWGPYFYNRFGYYSTNAFVAGNPVLSPYGYSLNGFSPILPGQGFSPPTVYPYSNVPGTLPLTNPGTVSNQPLNNAVQQDLQRWNDPDWRPEPSRKIQKYIVPSTRHARELSLRNQVKGDEYFQKLDYRRAYERYKFAASLAKDVATPHFKKGFALVALKQYDRAAYEFKQGLVLDPNWPVTGESLTELFGPENAIARDSMVHQVAEWVKEDIRDPERLFVFGVMLHFNGQTEQAHDVIETAARLAGRGDHFLAFLDPKVQQAGQQKIQQKNQIVGGHVVNPAHTRPPAFEKKSQPQPVAQPLGPKRTAPISGPLPPPPAVKQPAASQPKHGKPVPKPLPQINNLGLPPLPQAAGTPGAPLIPAPEPAKSQQTPLLIPPK